MAIWNAPTVTWEFRERPDPQGAIAREMIGAGLVSQEAVENFASKNIVFRDHVWTAAAAHIIREHRPHLMMFHLLTLDSDAAPLRSGHARGDSGDGASGCAGGEYRSGRRTGGSCRAHHLCHRLGSRVQDGPASDHAERRLLEGRVARGDRRQGRRRRRCT